MAKIVQLDRTEPAIEPELKDFIDSCLVPILVRSALKEIRVADLGDAVAQSISSQDIRRASGATR